MESKAKAVKPDAKKAETTDKKAANKDTKDEGKKVNDKIPYVAVVKSEQDTSKNEKDVFSVDASGPTVS